jgi:hypothetical protein
LKQFTSLRKKEKKYSSNDPFLTNSGAAMKRTAVIVLLTDFGLTDHYVASVKGTILSIAPRVTMVDLSHDVAAQNVDQAAFLLWSSYSYFPPGTLFVCVVDPGVGSGRRILYAEARGYSFLVPDNGILKFVSSDQAPSRIIDVRNTKYFLKKRSTTFHGRDIFAPVAAHLALGLPARKLGKETSSAIAPERFIRVRRGAGKEYDGKVLHIDHFGNIVTNFAPGPQPAGFTLHLGKKKVTNFSRTYEGARPGSPFMILGSSGLLEVSIRNGNAAAVLDGHLNQSARLRIR